MYEDYDMALIDMFQVSRYLEDWDFLRKELLVYPDIFLEKSCICVLKTEKSFNIMQASMQNLWCLKFKYNLFMQFINVIGGKLNSFLTAEMERKELIINNNFYESIIGKSRTVKSLKNIASGVS